MILLIPICSEKQQLTTLSVESSLEEGSSDRAPITELVQLLASCVAESSDSHQGTEL